jgi:hypothetical protein
MRFSRFTIIIGMLFFVAVASGYSALAQAGPEGAVKGLRAFDHLHDSAEDSPGQRTAGGQKQRLKEVSAHFKSGPYFRIILPRSEFDYFVTRYIDNGGHVEWDFELPGTSARIIGLKSPLGNTSVEFIEVVDELPDYRKQTRVMYVCDNVQTTLNAARDAGLRIVQPVSQTSVGFSGRFEFAPGYVIEVITLR